MPKMLPTRKVAASVKRFEKRLLALAEQCGKVESLERKNLLVMRFMMLARRYANSKRTKKDIEEWNTHVREEKQHAREHAAGSFDAFDDEDDDDLEG